jgi:hypothetical protein
MPKDPKTFKAPYISRNQCWAAADDFRQQHWPSGNIPVDVLSIVEFELDLEIRVSTGLKEDADVDALLLGDWKTLIVDPKQYMDGRFINRLRFSIAHELGHYVLHKAVFDEIPRHTPEEWMAFMMDIPDKEYSFLEYHANEFAGRLLVPLNELHKQFQDALREVEKNGLPRARLTDAHLSFLCNPLSRYFGVSVDVIERRLSKEGLWPL